jgi:hypothetical protein
VKTLPWDLLTQTTDLQDTGLDQVRCWVRTRVDSLPALFKLILEPYFNPAKRISRSAGDAAYRLGELVDASQRRHIMVSTYISLESWMLAWEISNPKGAAGITVFHGEPPQLPCI